MFFYISHMFSSNQRREMTCFAIVFVWTKWWLLNDNFSICSSNLQTPDTNLISE
mgnify:CR=1 FL=1